MRAYLQLCDVELYGNLAHVLVGSEAMFIPHSRREAGEVAGVIEYHYGIEDGIEVALDDLGGAT